MGRKVDRLNALQVGRLSKPGYYCDGAGLYLQVATGGSKSWILRFVLAGKPREMGLGSFRDFSLAEARQRAKEQRKLLTDGIDPIEAKQAQRHAQTVAKASAITFDQAAEAFIAANASGWRNAKHVDQWRNTLATYASPVIGDLPVQSVNTHLVLSILSPIWPTKTATATRVRGRIEKILDWAKVRGYRTGENPAAWRGHLSEVLPKPSKVADSKNHPALPWPEIGEFMADLRAMPGDGALALELIILTATRTSETLDAKWSEFDLSGRVWTIPRERMKTKKKEHRVPLTDAVLDILERLKAGTGGTEYLFPGRAIPGRTVPGAAARPLSNMACLAVLKRMGRADLTTHGFRSTFRDWASEQTAYPRDVCEMALAHTIPDKSEAAYRRGDLFEKRSRLMADWAAYCANIRTNADVLPIRREALSTAA